MESRLAVFALEGCRSFGAAVAAHLGMELAHHEERDFGDGEHKVRPLENVRGRDVYVLHDLSGEEGYSVNDRLIRLLFFIGALKDAGASGVTAVIPYLPYARKDRRSKRRDPVNHRYVAQLFEALGTHAVVTLEVHNRAAFDNAFRCRAEHLEPHALFVERLQSLLGDEPAAIVSPDTGGVKRAQRLCDTWERLTGNRPPLGFVEKHRSEGVVSGGTLVGPVENHAAVIIDDLVSGGTTLLQAAAACRKGGARKVYAAISHGLFRSGSQKLLESKDLDRLLVTDSVAIPDYMRSGIEMVSVTRLFADAIAALHSGDDSTVLET
ncbi:ribose-phosphate diphosphokinase [Marinobacteraceae bacterium S3BR75-40.1]